MCADRTCGLRTAPGPRSLGWNSRSGLCRFELVSCTELLQSNLLLTDGHHTHTHTVEEEWLIEMGFFVPGCGHSTVCWESSQ